jgi:ATP/maltotriose-dependent transcriptional regulator MalT
LEIDPHAPSRLGISGRELEVLAHLAAGRSNKEIAQRLEVSPNTVKTHVARLFEKLGARRRTQAILRARELGVLR